MALLSRENVLFCDWFLFKKTVQSKRIQSRKQGMWKGYHLSIAMRVFERGTLFVQKRYILEKGKGLDLRASGASPYKHLLSTPHPTPLALHTATRQITYHTLSPPQRHLCVFVSPARFLFFSIIAIFIGIPSGSLCGSRREYHTGASSWPLNSPFQPRSQGSLRENLGTRLLTVLLRSTCRPTGRLTHRILYVG